jgi:hypothetical protein
VALIWHKIPLPVVVYYSISISPIARERRCLVSGLAAAGAATDIARRGAMGCSTVGPIANRPSILGFLLDDPQWWRALRCSLQETQFTQDLHDGAFDAFPGLHGVDVAAEQEQGGFCLHLCSCAAHLIGALPVGAAAIEQETQVQTVARAGARKPGIF